MGTQAGVERQCLLSAFWVEGGSHMTRKREAGETEGQPLALAQKAPLAGLASPMVPASDWLLGIWHWSPVESEGPLFE